MRLVPSLVTMSPMALDEGEQEVRGSLIPWDDWGCHEGEHGPCSWDGLALECHHGLLPLGPVLLQGPRPGLPFYLATRVSPALAPLWTTNVPRSAVRLLGLQPRVSTGYGKQCSRWPWPGRTHGRPEGVFTSVKDHDEPEALHEFTWKWESDASF
jgi:hypothetical protein